MILLGDRHKQNFNFGFEGKMLKSSNKILLSLRNVLRQYCSQPKYIQGQSPEPKVREYFYFIDHQGMLFLDDSKMKNFTSCFKEKKFLDFFFRRIRLNTTGRYQNDFPYISLCGCERNFIRCDDVPIVFTHINNKKEEYFLTYGYAGDKLIVPFLPENIFMLPDTGRVYHPCNDLCGGIGLIRSKLAIELSKSFEFEDGEHNPPSYFTWNNKRYKLDQSWYYNKSNQYKIPKLHPKNKE